MANFDYKIETERLVLQAPEMLPDALNQKERDFIINILRDLGNKAGEALIKDSEIDSTGEEYRFSIQVLCEWIFHKSIDIILAGIHKNYWEPTLIKIAQDIFEILKDGMKKELEKKVILSDVEYQVNKTYALEVKKLYDRKSISEKTYENALKQSNIDTMSECEFPDYKKFFAETELKKDTKNEIENPKKIPKIIIFCCILMCIYRIIKDIYYIIIVGNFVANILIFVEIALLTSITILLFTNLFKKK